MHPIGAGLARVGQVEEPGERGGAPGARGGVALDPPTVIRCIELGSIDVMRLDRTLGQFASRCLRIKLYFDENFP
jgi:hypothetical protein